MVTQPETSTFPDVYEYEVLDPVMGGPNGIANLPLVQLASRTRYLLNQVNALALIVAAKAANDSPILTGTPTAPTPVAEASALQLVTAAWTSRRIAGAISVPISGNYALTLQQAAYGTLVIEGTLTGDTSLVFPDGVGTWRVLNLTVGGFKLKCRTSDPTTRSVPVVAGKTKTMWTDGHNFFQANDDLDSAVLSGTPTCSTPTQTDNSTRIINSAWARTYIGAALGGGLDALAASLAQEILDRIAGDANRFAGLGNDLRNPGFIDLPTGGTIRFGTSATSGTGQGCRINFATPFPNEALSCVVTEAAANGWGNPPAPTIFGTSGLDAAGVQVSGARLVSGGVPAYQPGLGFSYVAIGH